MSRFTKYFLTGLILLLVSFLFQHLAKELTEGVLFGLIIDPQIFFLSAEIFVILALSTVIKFDRILPKIKWNTKTSLFVVLCIAFAFRSSLQFLFPFYCGWDTGTYVAYSIYHSNHIGNIPQGIMQFGEIIPTNFPENISFPEWATLPVPSEPLLYTLSSVLVRLGMPPIGLVLVIIPLFSTLLLVPFFYIVKNIYSEQVALISVLFLTFASWQFRVLLDLYNSLVAIFFLLLSIYLFFFREKDKRVPYLTIISSTCMLLSSFFITIFAFLTMASFLIFWNRTKKMFLQLVTMVASVIILSSILTQTVYPVWLYDRYINVGISMYQHYAIGTESLQLYKSNLLLAYTKDIIRVILPMLPMIYTIASNRKGLKLHKIESSFIVSVTVLCCSFALLTTISAYEALDRSLIFLEFPLIMIASNIIAKKKDKVYLLAMLIWCMMFTVHHIIFWYGSATDYWNYFKLMVGGSLMPEPFHPSYVLEWITTCGVFAGLTFTAMRLKK